MRSRRIPILPFSVDAIAQHGTGFSMDVGVLRLHNLFAARSSYSAQEDKWLGVGKVEGMLRGAEFAAKNFGDAHRVPVVAFTAGS